MYERKDPPIDIDSLENTIVPFNEAVESTFYFETHVQPSKWKIAKDVADWYNIVRMLIKSGVSHRGYDYPDWRQFALLDLARPTRKILRTRIRWYDDFDPLLADNLIDINIPFLEKDDVISILARIRVGLEESKGELDDEIRELYLISLLHCKYELMNSCRKNHNTLLPVYNNIYSLFLVEFDIHPLILTNNSFWLVHSIMFLFPYEIGLLDRRSFLDKRSWLINNICLLKVGGLI